MLGRDAQQVAIRGVVVVGKIVVYIQDGFDLVILRWSGAECSRICQLVWIEVYGRLRSQAANLFRRHPYRVSIRPEAGSKSVHRNGLIGHHHNQAAGKCRPRQLGSNRNPECRVLFGGAWFCG